MANRRLPLRWRPALVHPLLTGLLAVAVHGGTRPPGPATLALCAAGAACLLCHDAHRPVQSAALAWALLAGLSTLVLQAFLARDVAPLAALAAAVLAFPTCALRLARDPAGGGVLTAAAVLVALPLWFGPWAEHFATRRWLVDGALALSPLGYLAAMTGDDLLRGDWFYRHSGYGLLRYDYPHALAASLGWLLLGLLGGRRRAAAHPIERDRKETAP